MTGTSRRAVLLILCATGFCSAQEHPIQVERVRITADQLQSLLKSQTLVPIQRAELDRRIAAARDGVRPEPVIVPQQVTYRARYVSGERLDGTFVADVTGEPPAKGPLVSLGISRFRALEIEEHLWGCDQFGNTVVALDENVSLQGSWSVMPQARPWGIEFTMTAFDAVASELILTLPAAATVETSGIAFLPGDASNGVREWRILLPSGRESQVAVVLHPETTSGVPRVESRINWAVRRDSMSFRSEYVLQSDRAIESVRVPLPVNSTVESVSYGDGTRLPIEIIGGNGRMLEVQLPRALVGTSRSLVVSGRCPPILETAWRVPSLSNVLCATARTQSIPAASRTASHRILIESPLELQQLQVDGFRQTDSVFDQNGSQTISLSRVGSAGSVSLQIGQAERTKRFQLFSRIGIGPGGYLTRCLLVSDAALGAETEFFIPAGMTLLAVAAGDDRTPCEFSVSDAPGGRKEVRVVLPPSESTFLDVRGYTDVVPAGPLCEVGSDPLSSFLIAPAELLSEAAVQNHGVAPGEVQTLLPPAIQGDQLITDESLVIDLSQAGPGVLTPPVTAPASDAPVDNDQDALQPTASTIRMELLSVLTSAPGSDLHTARIEVGARELLTFRLDARVTVSEVNVNGITTRFERFGDIVRVPVDPDTDANVVEVRYRFRAPRGGILTQRHVIPAVRFDAPASVRWNFELANGTRLVSMAPYSTVHVETTGLLTRLLGPFSPPEETVTEFGPLRFPDLPDSLSVTTTRTSLLPGYCWIGLALSVLLALLAIHYDRGVWLCAVAALFALLCAALPMPFAQVCGGCLIGTLLPLSATNIFRTSASSPVTNPVLSRIPSALRFSLLAAAAVWGINQASASLQSRSAYRVFETAGDTTVFVPQKLLDELEKASAPRNRSFLLGKATYVVHPGDGGLMVQAALDAVVLQPSDTEIALPFARNNVATCRVNGISTAPRRDGDSLLVTVPAGSDEDPLPRTAKVELEMHPAVIDGVSRLSLPGASGSTARVANPGQSHVLLNGAAVDSLQTFGLDQVLQITLRDRPHIEADPPAPAFETQTAVEVAANEVSLVHQIAVTPGTAPMSRLELSFPLTQHFRSFQSSATARHRVVRSHDSGLVSVDFETPVSEPVELKLTLAAGPLDPLRGCAFDVVPPVTGSPTATVTINARTGLEITELRQGEEPPVALPVGAAAEFEVDHSSTFRVRVRSLKPSREAWLEQQVRITADRLDYTARAELQILNGPVFQHTLVVDPALRIDSVAVRENRVDRLARYQRRGDQLLLLLDGRTSGVQEVLISGYLPARVGTQLALPAIAVAEAKTIESTLVLERDEDLDVELRNTDGVPFAVRPDAALTDSLETTGKATYRLLAETRLPGIFIRRRQPPLIESVGYVQPRTDAGRTVTWITRITARSRDASVTVNLDPAAITSSEGLLVTAVDGNTVITPQNERTSGILVATLNIAADDPRVPEPGWLSDCEQVASVLAIPNHLNLMPEGPDRSLAIVPQWAESIVSGLVTAYSGNGEWRLTEDARSVGETVEQTSEASFSETHLWLGERRHVGQTLLVAREAGRGLLLRVPDGVVLEAVELNRRSMPAPGVAEGLVRVPTGSDGSVWLRWKTDTASDSVRIPFAQRRSGESLFVLHTARQSVVNCERARRVGRDEFDTRRQQSNAPAVEPHAGEVVLLALDDNDTSSDPPLLEITHVAERGTLIGFGLLLGTLVGLGSLALQLVRVENRAAFVLVTLGVLSMTQGQPVPAAMLLLSAPLAWRFLPRRL